MRVEEKPPQFSGTAPWLVVGAVAYALVRYIFFGESAGAAAMGFLWNAVGWVVGLAVWNGLAAIPTPKRRRYERGKRDAAGGPESCGGRIRQ